MIPSRQWVRVTSGKPGPGTVGYIVREWRQSGLDLALIRINKPYPRDLVGKMAGTFERLSEMECAVRELVA